MAPARVSVVVPASNEEAYLARAIRSVRLQTLGEAEVVVVENGSTDGTLAMARALADEVVRVDRPCGFSHARNLGARAARGEVLVFLDADSWMAPDALERVLDCARPNYFGTVLGRPDEDRLRYRAFFALKNGAHRLRLYRGALGGLLFCHAHLFRRVGGFDTAKEVDEIRDFSVRARRAGGVHRLVTGTWASTSMRRFQRVGMLRALLFWARLRSPLGRSPARRGAVYEH